MRNRLIPIFIPFLLACVELPRDRHDGSEGELAARAANLVVVDNPCAGQERGAPCLTSTGRSDIDQCTGGVQCVDCVDNRGCIPSQICDVARRTCIAPPPASPPSTAQILCDVFVGEGGGFGSCFSDQPERSHNVRFEVFSTQVPVSTPRYEWTLATPAGEARRIEMGCGPDDRTCVLRITPRCSGATRTYSANVRISLAGTGLPVETGSAVATVTSGGCTQETPEPVTAAIPPSGGSVTLPGIGSFVFPAGAFSQTQTVTLAATDVLATRVDWFASAPLYGAFGRSAYELRLTTSVPPNGEVEVAFNRPLRIFVPEGFDLQVFAQMFEDAGSEIIDQFELIPSTFAPVDRSYRVTLPALAFTAQRTVDRNFEAVVLLSSTPAPPVVSSPAGSIVIEDPEPTPVPFPVGEPAPELALTTGPGSSLAEATDIPAAGASNAVEMTGPTCMGSSIGSPLAQRMVMAQFNETEMHFGTDYQAGFGTAVRAMADGTIAAIGVDERPLPAPSLRTGKPMKGLGSYVVLAHRDGSRTMYSHLQASSAQVQIGQPVSMGQVIASAGNTGGSAEPHLHVAYAPSGRLYATSSSVDPDACVDQMARGKINIRDNGNFLDDAFGIAINDMPVCRTGPGGTDMCAVGNLRPGSAQLGLFVLLAPDNEATYEILLSDGLTFGDGTFRRSRVLPSGGSAQFPILIPAAQKTNQCMDDPPYVAPDNPQPSPIRLVPFAGTLQEFGKTFFEPSLVHVCRPMVCVKGARQVRLEARFVIDQDSIDSAEVSENLRDTTSANGTLCKGGPRLPVAINRSIDHEKIHQQAFAKVATDFRPKLSSIHASVDACERAFSLLQAEKTLLYDTARTQQDPQHVDHKGDRRYRQVCFGPNQPTSEAACGIDLQCQQNFF